MRTVDLSLIIVLLCLIIYSCRQKQQVTNSCQNRNSSFITYDIDTAFYSFNVKSSDSKDTFAVVRELYVTNKSFGSFNQDNLQKAKDFCAKSQIDLDRVYLRYSINLKEQNHFTLLWYIDYPNYDMLYYPILEEAIALKAVPNEPHSSFEDYHYLRVIDKGNADLRIKFLNFRFTHNNWKLISKEKVTSDEETGYCIDTTSKHINGEGASGSATYIDFFEAFSRNYWDCK